MKVLVVMVVSLAATLWAGPAAAQDIATAEQLFEQGRGLMKQGQYEDACQKFEASQKLDPALGTLLNLANCYEKLGKLASAWGHFREAEDLARRESQTRRQAFARARAEALKPRLPRLVIEVPEAAPGLTVTRNGQAVEAALFGEDAYVDPGEHEIEASAPGYETFTTTVTAVEAEVGTVTIPELEPAAKPDAASQEGDSTDTSGAELEGEPGEGTSTSEPGFFDGTRRRAGLAMGGTGVVAVAVGLGFGWSAISTWDDAVESGLCDADTLMCTREGQDQADTARSHATLSNVLVGAGVVLVGAGVAMYLTAPRDAESERGTSVTPVAGPEHIGVAVTGRF